MKMTTVETAKLHSTYCVESRFIFFVFRFEGKNKTKSRVKETKRSSIELREPRSIHTHSYCFKHFGIIETQARCSMILTTFKKSRMKTSKETTPITYQFEFQSSDVLLIFALHYRNKDKPFAITFTESQKQHLKGSTHFSNSQFITAWFNPVLVLYIQQNQLQQRSSLESWITRQMCLSLRPFLQYRVRQRYPKK